MYLLQLTKENLVSVRIRMTRMGRKHRPFYRIVIIDRQKAREGKAIEEVGTYDPMVKDKSARVRLKMERIEYWQSVGATHLIESPRSSRR